MQDLSKSIPAVCWTLFQAHNSEHKSFSLLDLCEGNLPVTDGFSHKGSVIERITPVASFTKVVNPRLAKRPLKTNGRLANRGLTTLVKEATVAGQKSPRKHGFHQLWCVLEESPVAIVCFHLLLTQKAPKGWPKKLQVKDVSNLINIFRYRLYSSLKPKAVPNTLVANCRHPRLVAKIK